jgi:hypothetical protein
MTRSDGHLLLPRAIAFLAASLSRRPPGIRARTTVASIGLAAILAILALAPSALAAFPGPNGRIYYVWTDNPSRSNIASIQSNGFARADLTTHGWGSDVYASSPVTGHFRTSMEEDQNVQQRQRQGSDQPRDRP